MSKQLSKKERLKELINYYTSGNKAKFAELLGITPQGLSTWIARNMYDVDLIYANCECVSSDWLLTGEGNMLKDDTSTLPCNNNNNEPQSAILTEIYKEQLVNKDNQIIALQKENKALIREMGRIEGKLEASKELIEDLKKEIPAPGLFRAVK